MSVKITYSNTEQAQYALTFIEAVQKVEAVLGFKVSNFVKTKKDFDKFGRFGFQRNGVLAWVTKDSR